MSDVSSFCRAYFTGRRFAATGRLVSMTHAQLAELVVVCGGQFVRFPRRGQLTLIVGSDCWGDEATSAGDTQGQPAATRVLKRASQLRASGYPIETVREDQFLADSGLIAPHDRLRGEHTLGELSQILNVPASRLRRWARLGLIRPCRSQHRLEYYDFDEVAFARRLTRSLAAGASVADIHRQLQQLQQWLTDDTDLQRLVQLQTDGRVLLRLNETLLDSQGQRYFDFAASESAATHLPIRCTTEDRSGIDDWVDRAIECEDDERYDEARVLYEQALALEPRDPTLHFNLGNILYQLGEWGAAAARYRQAIDYDPDYAEAWNNLGNALAELEHWPEAIDALETAVQLVPTYADAHFNLAEVYRGVDRHGQACEHEALHHRHNATVRLWQPND